VRCRLKWKKWLYRNNCETKYFHSRSYQLVTRVFRALVKNQPGCSSRRKEAPYSVAAPGPDQWAHLITTTACRKAENTGARAVPARSNVDCATGVELTARSRTPLQPLRAGTTRAPVVVPRCAPDQLEPSYVGCYKRFRLAFIFVATIATMKPAAGCGPEFPNWLLAQGDQAVLVAPEANFAVELASMDLGRPRFHAIPLKEKRDYDGQSAEAELADLRKALKQAGTTAAEIERICNEHEQQRQHLAEFLQGYERWELSQPEITETSRLSYNEISATNAATLSVHVVDGLPAEFADYFEGFIAWHNPALTSKEAARLAWERLLARPETERRYKSTWAAFMLGKFWAEEEPEKAVSRFKQVRELARQGYRDSLGLAAASIGLEAKVRLAQANYEEAIELYLDQLATGDPTATNSLAFAACAALGSSQESLSLLAKNRRTQKVITAYLISRSRNDSAYGLKSTGDESPAIETESPTAVWLKAVEQAQITDVKSAEAFALAAYRANAMGLASRWIARAKNSPIAQWLQAKLLLREGKLEKAAALLAKVSQRFPIIHEGTNAPAPLGRKDSLIIDSRYSSIQVSAERQVHGELGVLRLARGEYLQALDSLVNAGFWMDAAYVAERVLTADELKRYVDRFWHPVSPEQTAAERERFGVSEALVNSGACTFHRPQTVIDAIAHGSDLEPERSGVCDVCPALLREQIRYLLARRLTREMRGDEAREYFPNEWVVPFDQLAANLRSGWDEALEPRERAEALFRAALITRTNGMELVGTEVSPDWHYHLGDYEEGVTGPERATNVLADVVRPLKDELRRDPEHAADPNTRFHYRYQAASLAWEAAKLLPNNDDRTAYILWRGGTFLKYKDPQCADVFYKALVRRNRKTALGAEADRKRWFPEIDDNGNFVLEETNSVVSTKQFENEQSERDNNAQTSESEPNVLSFASPIEYGGIKGYVYLIQSGDSLASIVHQFMEAGIAVRLEDIFVANPGLETVRLKVGARILVPASPMQGAEEQ
jgi:hypothetical protein